ncbi:hypothetical protein GCM10022377_02780 [Zhihengliuella alba]|uniref:Uncharacterized protein n=1 Tax=Zhihengliuella alba TaxID=547018 RepID=A0ABP7CSQ1_9MICC
MKRPESGANSRRVNANTETMTLAAVTDTPKLAAYCGSSGAMIPKPIAITNAAPMRTRISTGMAGLTGEGEGAGVVMARPV